MKKNKANIQETGIPGYFLINNRPVIRSLPKFREAVLALLEIPNEELTQADINAIQEILDKKLLQYARTEAYARGHLKTTRLYQETLEKWQVFKKED